MVKAAARSAVVVVLGLAALGCSAGGPKVAVGDARIVHVGADHVAIQVSLQAHNQNDVPLRLLEYTYTLSVNGQAAYSGRRAALATLPAESTSNLVIPAVAPRRVLSASGSGTADARYWISGELTFLQPGTVHRVLYDAGLLRPAQDFAGEGVIAPGQ